MNDIDRRLLLGGLAGAAGISALAAMAKGGPLSPPAGPVIGTSKPLGEVEPRIAINAINTPSQFQEAYRINSPGSYYLTGHTSVPGGGNGIVVAAPDVTIDLNGFTISGANVAIVAGSDCTVRNGRLRGNTYGFEAFSGTRVLLEDLEIIGCSARAVFVGGRGTVRRCQIEGASEDGVWMNNGTVEDCLVSGATPGIVVFNAGRVSRCHVSGCVGGVSVGAGSLVERCVIQNCTGTSIQTGARSLVEGCAVTAQGGTTVGVQLGDGSTLADSSCAGAQIGARGGAATRIVRCTFDGNTSSGIRFSGSQNIADSCTLTRNLTAVDMLGAAGNYVHRCIMLGNTNSIGVNVGGNWYPNVALGGVNTATNPLASVIG